MHKTGRKITISFAPYQITGRTVARRDKRLEGPGGQSGPTIPVYG